MPPELPDTRPRGRVELNAPLGDKPREQLNAISPVTFGEPALINGKYVYEHPGLDADTVEMAGVFAVNLPDVPDAGFEGRQAALDKLAEIKARP